MPYAGPKGKKTDTTPPPKKKKTTPPPSGDQSGNTPQDTAKNFKQSSSNALKALDDYMGQLSYADFSSQDKAQTIYSYLSQMNPADAQSAIKALSKVPGYTGSQLASAVTNYGQQGLGAQAQGAPGTGISAPDNAITMGLRMFFTNYLQPIMNGISGTNNNLISQYGQMANAAANNPNLPPGVAQILKSYAPQDQKLMSMLNQASASQAAGAAPMQDILNQLGMETSTLGGLEQAYQHTATAQDIGLNPVALSQYVTQLLGGASSPYAAFSLPLGGTSGTTGGLPPVPGAIPPPNQNPQQNPQG